MADEKQQIWAESHLDAMRGLAALAVVYSHVRGLILPSAAAAALAPEARHLSLGHAAVMVFFVLSGYLVGGSVLRSFQSGTWSWRDYLVKRLVRLWVVLVPAIALGLVLDMSGAQLFGGAGSLYSGPDGQEYVSQAALEMERNPSIILGNIFFLQTILVPTIGTNIPLWSLANEFWYYLAFPLLLLAVHPASRPLQRVTGALAGIAILALIGWNADVLMLPWLMGAAVSQCPKAAIPPAWRVSAAWIAIVAWGGVFVATKIYVADLHSADMLAGLATSVLLYVVTSQDGMGKTGLYGRISGFLAQLSYTLYLTHLPFLIFLFAAFHGSWRFRPPSFSALAEFLGMMVAALVWAWGCHQLFESRTDAARQAVMRIIRKAPSPSMPPD